MGFGRNECMKIKSRFLSPVTLLAFKLCDIEKVAVGIDWTRI
jgi:hypothetical protein